MPGCNHSPNGDLTFLANDPRTPYVAAFDAVDANKATSDVLRSESTRGEPESWSETASALIGVWNR